MLCMTYEKNVYDDRVLLGKSNNIVMKKFLKYEFDHDC